MKNSYRYNKKLLVRKMNETTMVYNPENSDMYELNGIGQLVLEKVQDDISVEKIVEDFSREFDEDKNVIKRDVEEIFKRFIDLGIVLLKK